MGVCGEIVGLALTRELVLRHPDITVTLLEKEPVLGPHASGRNSGVLYSGIYYPPSSLKAPLCAEGSREMAAYCDAHSLLNMLLERARANGAYAEIADRQGLKALEPESFTAFGLALWVPDTSVIDPRKVLDHLKEELMEAGGWNSGWAGSDRDRSCPQRGPHEGGKYSFLCSSDQCSGTFFPTGSPVFSGLTAIRSFLSRAFLTSWTRSRGSLFDDSCIRFPT